MKNYETIAEYFLELASADRLYMMDLLNDKNYRVSELAKKIDSTAQETHRNLSRLIQYGLVEKAVDGKYQITNTGKMLNSISSIPVFIHKNKSFFKDHSFESLPEKFIRRFGALEGGNQISGVSKVLQKCKSICENSKKFLYDMSPESYSILDKSIMSKVQQDIIYRHIIPKNHSEETSRPKKLEKLGYYDALEKKTIKRKIVDSTEFSLFVNEKEAGIMFPDKNRKPDPRIMFYGNDKFFHNWCLDLFDHFWKKGNYSIRKPNMKVKN